MKYSEDIGKMKNCPPSNCVQSESVAYRFVFKPIESYSFLPQGKKKPERVGKSRSDSQKCSLLGLSFFSSQEKAATRFHKLKKMMPNIHKTLGTHIAQGTLKQVQGYQTPICSKVAILIFLNAKMLS